MARHRVSRKDRPNGLANTLVVRLDRQSKKCIEQAAELRQISVSDYVRTVTVSQARREVAAARQQVLVLTPEEQLAFWNALHEAPRLTEAQRRLAAVMRGKA